MEPNRAQPSRAENEVSLPSSPLVLFGAFDRHNFGDLLFPHLLTALLPGQAFECAGLAARDLRAFGGHRVKPLARGAMRGPPT